MLMVGLIFFVDWLGDFGGLVQYKLFITHISNYVYCINSAIVSGEYIKRIVHPNIKILS